MDEDTLFNYQDSEGRQERILFPATASFVTLVALLVRDESGSMNHFPPPPNPPPKCNKKSRLLSRWFNLPGEREVSELITLIAASVPHSQWRSTNRGRYCFNCSKSCVAALLMYFRPLNCV